MEKEIITIYVDKPIKDKLLELASAEKRSLSSYLSIALEKVIEESK
jgi:predicted transcriptional regulator